MMDRRKRGEKSAWAEDDRQTDAPQQDEPVAQEPAGAAQPGVEAAAPEEAPAGESPDEIIARLEAEKAELGDRLLRVAADMDNLRKRAERDLGEAGRYAIARFAADMLTVADNLRRALEAVPAELREAGEAGAAALIEGVEMTAREFDRLMAKHGVERIAAEGERFDPHRHQAMFEVPDPSAVPGTVVQVVQDGYTIGDRVLRAAMVGVAKAAPVEPSGGEGDEAPSQGEAPTRAARSG